MIDRLNLFAATVIFCAGAAAFAPDNAAAQPDPEPAAPGKPSRHFEGLYLGVEGGRQHVVGAGDIGGVEVLEEEMRGAAEIIFGGRVQLNRLVLGVEGGAGLTRANGRIDLPADDLSIAFNQKSQFSFGGQAGVALGADRDWLIFSYVTKTKRRFDVEITQAGATVNEGDKQGMLRFGGGVEHVVYGPLRLRVKAGTGRAKFNDVTSLNPPKRLEVNGALIFQF